MNFKDSRQPLANAIYLPQEFLLVPSILWNGLHKETQLRLLKELEETIRITPAINNWFLFAFMVEACLLNMEINIMR